MSKPNSSVPQRCPRHTLKGHEDFIGKVAWSVGGRFLASPSADRTVRIWDTASGDVIQLLRGHSGWVIDVAWAPDGGTVASVSEDGTLRLWDVKTGSELQRVEAHDRTVLGVSWSPLGDAIATSSDDGTIRIWNPHNLTPGAVMTGHLGGVLSVSWSPDGALLASASDDRTVRIWERDGTPRFVLRGHDAGVKSVSWAPDGSTLASASDDRTIRIWNAGDGRDVWTLEAHTDKVIKVSFSADGRLLASNALRNPCYLWLVGTWQRIRLSDQLSPATALLGGASFAPDKEKVVLATLGNNDHEIRIWELDYDQLAHEFEVVSRNSTETYANAKIVLVGDSGVGKTGLSNALVGRGYKSTDSTHHRRVLRIGQPEIVPLAGGLRQVQEMFLWDLPGQEGYRLTNQLHLNEATVGVVVYDGDHTSNRWSAVQYWDHALRQANQLDSKRNAGNQVGAALKKFLVAARTDVSPAPADLTEHCKRLEFDDHFETSAKNGTHVDALRVALRKSIEWNALPNVKSNHLFQTIMNFLQSEREREDNDLTTVSNLRRLFLEHRSEEQRNDTEPTTEEFETCIGRADAMGLLRRFGSGGVVLLRPERLDDYAAELLRYAHKASQVGFIPEEDARSGRFLLGEDDTSAPIEDDDRLLCSALVEDLVNHEIVFRYSENGQTLLVFPSQASTDSPYQLDELAGKTGIFRFNGAADYVYSTLAVRLVLTGKYELRKRGLFSNSVSFAPTDSDGICGLVLRDAGNGEVDLFVFCDDLVSDEVRAEFTNYVRSHLEERAPSVEQRPVVTCKCGHTLSDAVVQEWLKQGNPRIPCPCGKSTLVDVGRTAELTEFDRIKVKKMNVSADREGSLHGWITSALTELQSDDTRPWISSSEQVTFVYVEALETHGTSSGVLIGGDEGRHASRDVAEWLRAELTYQNSNGDSALEIGVIRDTGDDCRWLFTFRSARNAVEFLMAAQTKLAERHVAIRAGLDSVTIENSRFQQFNSAVDNACQAAISCATAGRFVLLPAAKGQLFRTTLSDGQPCSADYEGFHRDTPVWSIGPETRQTLQKHEKRILNGVAGGSIQDPLGSVFLSYRTTHEALVRRLKEVLELHGINAWMYQLEERGLPDFHEKIKRAIKENDAFVMCYGPGCRVSEEQKKEFREAESPRNHPIHVLLPGRKSRPTQGLGVRSCDFIKLDSTSGDPYQELILSIIQKSSAGVRAGKRG